MSTIHAYTWIVAAVDTALVAHGETPERARGEAARRQLPIDREHFPELTSAEVEQRVGAWASGLRTVRLELHGDAVAVRAVLLHLATELPELMLLPPLAEPLRVAAAQRGAA
jgi:hypothetical protein